ncbi:peroxiredoxin family protein [Mucilaginibacter pallidiroseus]|nr:TlpA disulfide reductase family protein [Mucilaginibacter pallidiroseus]
MKKHIILAATMLAFLLPATAQKTIIRNIKTLPSKVGQRIPDETSVVKDSTGKVLTYNQWHTMMIEGTHSLRRSSLDPENQYKLVRLSPREQKERKKRLALYQSGQLQPTAAPQEIQRAIGSAPLAQKDTEEERMARLPMPRESGSFVNGTIPANFHLFDMDGKRADLKELKGKVVVLNFWFIGCPPCRQEIPELNKIVDGHINNPNVVFLAIGLDRRKDIQTFTGVNPFKYRQVASGQSAADIYGVHLYPTNVVIDKTGVVRFNSCGFAANTPYWINKTINESLAAN